MTDEGLRTLLRFMLVTACYLGYVLIFIKILINKIHAYIDKPELILVVGIAPQIAIFGGFVLLNVLDGIFTKIIGG